MADGCLEVSIAADLLMHRARSRLDSYLDTWIATWSVVGGRSQELMWNSLWIQAGPNANS